MGQTADQHGGRLLQNRKAIEESTNLPETTMAVPALSVQYQWEVYPRRSTPIILGESTSVKLERTCNAYAVTAAVVVWMALSLTTFHLIRLVLEERYDRRRLRRKAAWDKSRARIPY